MPRTDLFFVVVLFSHENWRNRFKGPFKVEQKVAEFIKFKSIT